MAAAPLARLVLGLAFLILLVASIATTVTPTAIHWHGERVRFEHLNQLQRRLYSSAISIPNFDPLVFESARRALRPGERFAFQTGLPGGLGPSVQAYARYYLLPNVMVARASDADVVLSYLADPRRLGLRYASVRRLRPYFLVSRVDHGR